MGLFHFYFLSAASAYIHVRGEALWIGYALGRQERCQMMRGFTNFGMDDVAE